MSDNNMGKIHAACEIVEVQGKSMCEALADITGQGFWDSTLVSEIINFYRMQGRSPISYWWPKGDYRHERICALLLFAQAEGEL